MLHITVIFVQIHKHHSCLWLAWLCCYANLCSYLKPLVFFVNLCRQPGPANPVNSGKHRSCRLDFDGCDVLPSCCDTTYCGCVPFNMFYPTGRDEPQSRLHNTTEQHKYQTLTVLHHCCLELHVCKCCECLCESCGCGG